MAEGLGKEKEKTNVQNRNEQKNDRKDGGKMGMEMMAKQQPVTNESNLHEKTECEAEPWNDIWYEIYGVTICNLETA
jgi:hypothetical protein